MVLRKGYVNYFFLPKITKITNAITPIIKIHLITESIPFNKVDAALLNPKSINTSATMNT